MSADEQVPATATATVTPAADATDNVTDTIIEQERSEKILKAKELYSHGSRNFLVKSYAEAADELSQVCALYEELYGEQSDELGMPYLLYAKSLIALALDENKVIDVPDEEALEDDAEEDVDSDDDDDDAADAAATNDSAQDAAAANDEGATSSTNGAAAEAKLATIAEQEGNVADSTALIATDASSVAAANAPSAVEKTPEDAQVSSSNDNKAQTSTNGAATNGAAAHTSATATVASRMDGEKPSTSNGGNNDAAEEEDEDENEAASNLQLAWEILELAAKIFSRQGMSGLPNLAEVQTELANIEFENNIPESARLDYEKALQIYSDLPSNYRRAMAEIHYKIGLTYLMQQLNKEGADALKAACTLIDAEIVEMQEKDDELTEKDKNNIQDMEETKQEIWAKIAEIEDTQAQNIAEVRAALDSYIKPITSENVDGAGPSSSSCTSSTSATAGVGATSTSISSSKPNDISHLIKRKKPDEQNSEAEAASSPAKRPAL